MMNHNAVVHFEIPADDVERAMAFYKNAFGWKFNKWEMPSDSSTGGKPYYGVVTTESTDDGIPKKAGAINGGLMERAHPGHVMTNYISVESIDDAIANVSEHGGTVVMPKTEIAPGMGFIAMFKDSEGNMMGLHQIGEGMKKKMEGVE